MKKRIGIIFMFICMIVWIIYCVNYLVKHSNHTPAVPIINIEPDTSAETILKFPSNA